MGRSILSTILIIILILLVIAGIGFVIYQQTQVSIVPAPVSIPSGGIPTSSSTSTSTASTTSPTASSSASTFPYGMTVIDQQDQNTIVTLALNQRFIIQLGNSLNWSLDFTPSGIINRVPNSTTANGVQGIYEADEAGTTTLRATGAPICDPGQACPQFLELTTINFKITP